MKKRDNSSAEAEFHARFVEFSTEQTVEQLKVETLKTLRTLIEYRGILVEVLDDQDLTEELRNSIQMDIRKINHILKSDKKVTYTGTHIDLTQCTATHMTALIREAEQGIAALRRRYTNYFEENNGSDDENIKLRH